MITIHLHQIKLHAFHGLYKEEKRDGNDFELNLDIVFPAKEKILRLQQTIDYVEIFDIIKKRMAIPTPLLETVAQDLAQLIHEYDARIHSISITIKKLNPPIPDFVGEVGVSFKTDF